MSIESLAPYSPDTVYGHLTSPFKPSKITINAHTPLYHEFVKNSRIRMN